MPALSVPRFIPHGKSGAAAGAGAFNAASDTQAHRPDALAHDARNVISALTLYCELLAAPGVLSECHTQYAHDLQTITQSAARLIERMATAHNSALPVASAALFPAVPLIDIAEELRHLQPLLAAIAGPSIRLSVATMPCAGRTALTVEDLTRILVNLVRNAADAMSRGGTIRITAQYGDGCSFLESALTFVPPRSVMLTVVDDGPGISEALRDRIFELGFTTRVETEQNSGASGPSPRRRGVGLSIVRNLVEAAGGNVRATSAGTRGARFEITIPLTESITSGMCPTPHPSAFAADSHRSACIECD